MNLENMNLGELFAAADAIGDKYLTPEEIEQRNKQLEALRDYPTEEDLLDQ